MKAVAPDNFQPSLVFDGEPGTYLWIVYIGEACQLEKVGDSQCTQQKIEMSHCEQQIWAVLTKVT